MILLIYTIFTVIVGSGGDSSDDDETPTIDINSVVGGLDVVISCKRVVGCPNADVVWSAAVVFCVIVV